MSISPRYTREIPQRFRLEAQKFSNGQVSLARRIISPDGTTAESEKITLSGFGTILTFTVIHIASDDFAKETPYAVAIVETDEGARLTTQIVDCSIADIKIGGKVEFIFRKLSEEGLSGIINYGYKALLV